MTTEAGDMKVIGNFRKLIDWVSADPNYKPSNAALTVIALEAQYAASLAAIEAVATFFAPHKAAINLRRAAFAKLTALGRSIRNVMKASGVSQDTIATLETPLRKLVGARKSEKVKADPNTPGAEDDKQHSASQMSFENRIGSYNTIVAIVATVASYNPNEPNLKLVALQAFGTELEAINNAVNTAFVPLSQGRALRDQLLYDNDNSVVNIALMVKSYVIGALGRDSHLNQQIKGLKFVRK